MASPSLGVVEVQVDEAIEMTGPAVANDPDGDRWTRHLDRLIDLYLDDAKRRRRHR